MSNIDWSMLITKDMKLAEIAKADYEAKALVETAWVRNELLVIADQLLALEDDDPNRMPGTDREWRDYRIKVRAWKDGAVGYPDKDKHPSRPIGD